MRTKKAPEIPDFPWGLLKRVSRSFYLSLRLLPPGIQEPISLAYLLARLSDTEADGVESPAEKELLERKAELLALLEKASHRGHIESVWSTIQKGQRFDLERFQPVPQPALDAQELDDYTYLVAGCVGEFWTQICSEVLPGFSNTDSKKLLSLGISFGKGLQLVNILRDRTADRTRGRIYVEEDRVPEVLTLARDHLTAARAYCRSIRPVRLHAACLLPCLLAGETLDLVAANPARESVKVPRSRVRILLLKSLATAVLQRWTHPRNP